MPDPKPPRRPAPDPKPMFEVVEDPPPFEVVEDDPPPVAKPAPKAAAKPVPSAAAKPAAKPPAKPPVKAVRAKPAREEDDRDEDEPRPKPKKKKKKKREIVQPVDESEVDRERKLRNFEWVVPGVLLIIGLILAFVGAVGASKLGAVFTMLVMAVSLVISVPLTIVALMVIGIVMGIEYGRLGPAVLKIAAITCMATGIMYIGAWLKLPGMLVFPISCFVSFGLFMTQFDLDTWETNVSVGALNGLTFLAKVVLIGVVLAVAQKGDRGKDSDDGPVPSDTRPGGKPGPGFQPPVGDDDRDE